MESRKDNDRQLLQLRCLKAGYQVEVTGSAFELQDEQMEKCKRKNKNGVNMVRKAVIIAHALTVSITVTGTSMFGALSICSGEGMQMLRY